MIQNIYIKNFALINEVNLSFTSGFNILSGETGAGKSIIINAISLLKGQRVNKGFLGQFADYSIVEGQFYIDDSEISYYNEKGIDIEDNQLIVTRRFTRNSSNVRINNRIVNLSLLQDISENLLDIHGQHSQLLALNKSNYINILDGFKKKETSRLKRKLEDNLINKKKLEDFYNSLNISDEEIIREKDLLLYQMDEIDSFDFDSYEEDELNLEYKKLSSISDIQNNINQIQGLIREGSYSNRTLKDNLTSIISLMDEIVDYDKELKVFEEELINLKDLVDDFSRSLDSYYYSISFNESRLKTIENIFENFQNLKRKYGRNADEILSFYQTVSERYNLLNEIEDKRKKIKNDLYEIDKENQKISMDLSNIRKNIAIDFEKNIILELSEMNIKNILFRIHFSKSKYITEFGYDIIDFLISTNKGQDMKSLNQVASGGEISRFMLALKAITAEYEDVKTIIFDEIDTGISGRTAQVVGEKLLKISKKRQLIVISHLPQIAALADTHFLIEKNTYDNRTISNVKRIDKEERVEEIARLISGVNITDLSISSAEEMLDLTKNL